MKTPSLEGQRFGYLTVKHKTQGRRDGSVVWLCSCDCGRECQVTTRHLNREKNTIRSCGCKQYKTGKEHHQWDGVGEISGHWFAMRIEREKWQKTRPKITVSVTKEDLWKLFLKQHKKCALTGIDLTISNNRALNTASIDRIDSSLGYDIENLQFVHKDVNMMKRWYNQDYFIKMCKLVASNQK